MNNNKQYQYDLAFSFAGEERDIVFPIAECLKKEGVKIFYDMYEQDKLWGKNVYEYLSDVYKNQARYCLIFVSNHYIEKAWTTHEWKQAQARALNSREEYILPVILEDTKVPALLETIGYIDYRKVSFVELIQLILRKLGREKDGVEEINNPNKTKKPVEEFDIPMPNIKKKFTQLDRDKYLRESYNFMREYFKKGLKILERKCDEIQTDFQEITTIKFICKIYQKGEMKNQCKIWIGGWHTTESIAYSAGQNASINNDNSMNDSLSVEDEEGVLGLRPMAIMLTPMVSKYNNKLLDHRQASEYFWLRYIEVLNL